MSGTPVAAGAQEAAGCSTVVSRAGLSEASGARIGSVRIVTHPPRPYRRVARVVNRLHARTVAPTVRRELLFAAGDTVDTLRVAESLRRLRYVGYLDDVWLRATRCGAAPLALVVETRDAWSTLPEAGWTTGQQVVGVHETNLLGTGRTLSVVLRRDADRLEERYRLGGQLGISDPAVTRTVAAGASLVQFVDGRAWALAAGTRRRTLADRWTASASISQFGLRPANPRDERIRRDRAAILVGRRISPAASAPTATYLLAGLEVEHSRVDAAAGSAVLGAASLRRSFAGPMAGVAVRAVRFDTLTWLLPRGGVADLPRGTEAELVAGGGHDAAGGAPAVRASGWVGRAWRVGRRGAVVADGWAGAYANTAGRSTGGGVSAASVRLGAIAFRGAGNGVWTARLGAERRMRPDPDARAFVGIDPTATVLPGRVRLAAGTVAGSVERSVHLRPVTRSLVLDGALFAAGSRRWQPAADETGDRVTLALAGIGLRLAPTRPGQPTAGLDLGYPLVRPATLRAGPVVRVLVVPWLGGGRRR